ncbi:twitching motility protein PilT [Sphingomonas panacis]|uniref:Twitching motility protein PilT n=1 Tax=Sphingomonas panacis TaxID=1560345 RepID=A0A1B3ZDN8_9SPHN|nr:type II toxin-antitoxin system VapC family toxin [Sphingomonas panacis]AOH85526.1 twitching motility protein PilT [Sphingomonas panacis]
MSRIVLDASALIALVKGEAGATIVAEAIAGSRMSSVNYAEVVSHFIHAGMPEREIDMMLDPLPIDVVPLDKDTAKRAGRLRAATASAGLSLGDRCCLALSIQEALPAWTADKAWRNIAETTGAEIVVIR